VDKIKDDEPQTDPQEMTTVHAVRTWRTAQGFDDSEFIDLLRRSIDREGPVVLRRVEPHIDARGRPRAGMWMWRPEPRQAPSRRGAPLIADDPGPTYETWRERCETWPLQFGPPTDRNIADKIGVSIRTLEGWRARGLIGGGRKRRGV
jgi:hypothetical protein